MQRLKTELPLGPDQLENVFDLLDEDASGYLTLDEFTRGFEGYLGIDPHCVENKKDEPEEQCNQEFFYEECYGKIYLLHPLSNFCINNLKLFYYNSFLDS